MISDKNSVVKPLVIKQILDCRAGIGPLLIQRHRGSILQCRKKFTNTKSPSR